MSIPILSDANLQGQILGLCCDPMTIAQTYQVPTNYCALVIGGVLTVNAGATLVVNTGSILRVQL